MKRISIMSIATLTILATAATASAQVFVRAPFVRVQVGGPGVYVRAPFVNLFVPGGPPPVYVVPESVAPPQPFVAPAPAQQAEPIPLPKQLPDGKPPAPQPKTPPPPPKPMPPTEKVQDQTPPQPSTPERVLTIEQFAKSFQPKEGNYEVTLLNPVTKAPTTVRFTLPEGTPRRVNVARNEIEFNYGFRRFVRIQFDREGVEVIAR
jgi:hypothetical protein